MDDLYAVLKITEQRKKFSSRSIQNPYYENETYDSKIVAPRLAVSVMPPHDTHHNLIILRLKVLQSTQPSFGSVGVPMCTSVFLKGPCQLVTCARMYLSLIIDVLNVISNSRKQGTISYILHVFDVQ